jgi:ligand-binding sensor domain-containing protein
VSDIVQDHQGYLWFATHVGVARYDGYTFEHFNLSDGLPNEVIAYEETDDLGMFAFENVPDGDYLLHVEVPGLDMLETHEVSVAGNQIVSGLDYTISDEGIYIGWPTGITLLENKTLTVST